MNIVKLTLLDFVVNDYSEQAAQIEVMPLIGGPRAPMISTLAKGYTLTVDAPIAELPQGQTEQSMTPEPLRATVEVSMIETVLEHLENALAPRVKFCDDLTKMQQEAERERITAIQTAIGILRSDVAGLKMTDWPDLSGNSNHARRNTP